MRSQTNIRSQSHYLLHCTDCLLLQKIFVVSPTDFWDGFGIGFATCISLLFMIGGIAFFICKCMNLKM